MSNKAVAAPWRVKLAYLLLGFLLLGLLVMICVVGPAASYIAMLSALAGVILLFDRAMISALVRERIVQINSAAFVLLAAAFALSARQLADLAASGDFAVLLLTLPALAILRMASHPRAALWMATIAWLGAGVAVVGGLVELQVFQVGRAQGGFSAIYYSDIGLMLGFLALFGIFAPGPRWKWALASGPALGLACMQLGGTRGALVGAVVLGIVALGFALASWPRRWPVIIGAIAAVASVLVAVALLIDVDRMLAVPGLIGEALQLQSSSDASLNYRLEFYRAGLMSFLESPIFGHGWWQRFAAATPYMSAAAAALFSGPSAHLHNDAVNFASAAGSLGLLAYLIMILGPIWAAFTLPRDAQWMFRLSAVTALCLGFFAFGLSDSVFVFEVGKTFYVLGVVAILGFCRDEPLRV